MPDCSALEREILDAAIRGDKNKTERLKAQLAYETLPDDVRREYKSRLLALDDANRALNAVIEQIPDFFRGKVIERLKAEAFVERAAANLVTTASKQKLRTSL
jgi:hypothetical protein